MSLEIEVKPEDEWKGQIFIDSRFACTLGVDLSGESLAPKQKEILQKNIKEALLHLDRDKLMAFYDNLEYLAVNHNWTVQELVPGLPLPRLDLYQKTEFFSKAALFIRENINLPLVMLGGVAGFIGGALGAGSYAEYNIDSQYWSHLVTATGAAGAGVLGVGLMASISSLMKSYCIQQSNRVGEKLKDNLMAEIQQYCSDNANP